MNPVNLVTIRRRKPDQQNGRGIPHSEMFIPEKNELPPTVQYRRRVDHHEGSIPIFKDIPFNRQTVKQMPTLFSIQPTDQDVVDFSESTSIDHLLDDKDKMISDLINQVLALQAENVELQEKEFDLAQENNKLQSNYDHLGEKYASILMTKEESQAKAVDRRNFGTQTDMVKTDKECQTMTNLVECGTQTVESLVEFGTQTMDVLDSEAMSIPDSDSTCETESQDTLFVMGKYSIPRALYLDCLETKSRTAGEFAANLMRALMNKDQDWWVNAGQKKGAPNQIDLELRNGLIDHVSSLEIFKKKVPDPAQLQKKIRTALNKVPYTFKKNAGLIGEKVILKDAKKFRDLQKKKTRAEKKEPEEEEDDEPEQEKKSARLRKKPKKFN